MCILLGLGTTYAAGKFDTANIVGTITAIYTASHLVYVGYFKHLPWNDWLEQQKGL